MLVLAIDTATPDLVVGLVRDAATLAEHIHRGTRQHAELLIPSVQQLLADQKLQMSDLDSIVVGCGPGPFTGLRVGMATAQALGQALTIPVHGVVSLDAIAHRLGGTGLVVTDARRREVYWALYRDGQRVEGPSVCRPADLHPVAELGGVTAMSVPRHLAPQLAHLALETRDLIPDAASLIAVADFGETPGPLVAHYLRRPDAVPPQPAQVPAWK